MSVALPAQSALANGCDNDFLSSNDILFYNPCEQFSSSTCATSSSNSVLNNQDYAGNTLFNDSQLAAIEENRPFYQKAAELEDIPWQILAVIHYRETTLARTGPSNGQGPYQFVSGGFPVSKTYTDEQFQDATNKAATFVKQKANGKDLTQPDNVKAMFFAYNGKAKAYIDQAKRLGFTDEEAQNGEGSPYVMNRFDVERDPTASPTSSNNTWGQILRDHGSIEYPANEQYGAFVYYNALTNGGSCGNAVAKNGDVKALQTTFVNYMNSNNEVYGSYVLGVNGCTTLSSWYIGENTTLQYGGGNGGWVVRNLVASNKDRGLVSTDKPTAPSIFSVAPGVREWGSSGSEYGHVGIVVSVDEASQTATVLHTGKTQAGSSNKSYIQTFKYPMSGVTFTYIGDYLK